MNAKKDPYLMKVEARLEMIEQELERIKVFKQAYEKASTEEKILFNYNNHIETAFDEIARQANKNC